MSKVDHKMDKGARIMNHGTKKVVINRCYGGFAINKACLFKLAEIKGLTLYPEVQFPDGHSTDSQSTDGHSTDLDWNTTYWTVPESNPHRQFASKIQKNWHKASSDDKVKSNKICIDLTLYSSPSNREDPDLIKAIESLGCIEASGRFALLKIVEIPDNITYLIEEKNGLETIHESHRIWY
jgi:hypothetical protein